MSAEQRLAAQVRNTANGIVQLSYGDDGLDPLLMEGEEKGRPLNFLRFLDVVRATHPRPREVLPLLPDQMNALADQEMIDKGARPRSWELCRSGARA